MSNPMHFDSDWDYHDACMSDEDRVVQALTDGESSVLTERYVNWMLSTHPDAVAELLIDTAEAHKYLELFAKITITEDAEP